MTISSISAVRSAVSVQPAGGTGGLSYGVPRTGVLRLGAWMNFGTVRLERIASADSITEFVPGFLISSLGIVPVTVTDPGAHGSTGATSTRVQAIINGVRH